MPYWTFLSNHGLVLVYIAKHPQSTVRDIAYALKITEWTVYKIIKDLESERYIERQKEGRNNVYYINRHSPMRHETVRETRVEDMLNALGWQPPQ
jgi:DNA-binding MarR family transcriptional regulator